ncbi:hypothetical protein Taro_020718 [Colocasia esculenta]|uniref:tRNA dimethylallyltransferase n=1 Tax=Colocasia esculenta TaxID=4460 RepID=A0A843V624_COLES|nr:hypothetical protein [Colocasia esculenta]
MCRLHLLAFSGLLSQSSFVLRFHPYTLLPSLPFQMGLSLPLLAAGYPLMSGAVGLTTWSFRFASSTRLTLFHSNVKRRKPMLSLTCHCQRRPVISCSNAEEKRNRVIVISGPTGAGKSKLALELAKRVDGEIVSADSVQVYRGLDIGSAKPSTDDRKEVTHHLIDILDPSDEYSVGQFFEDARKATDEILGRQRVPIVVGGTGLYLRWYIYGKPDVPVATKQISGEAHSELLHLERTGQWDAAVELVAEAGDTRARSLATNDWYRLRRSLEIIKSTGSPPSSFAIPYDSFKQQMESKLSNQMTDGLGDDASRDLDYDFTCFFLSSPRVDLYRYIDVRCEEMLMGSPGILSEASWLLDIGLLPNASSATRAIGYRQAMEYLLHCRHIGGQCSPGDFYAFLSEFQKASRNFAKRQITWFRNEYLYEWLDASRPLEEVLSFIYDSYKDSSGNLMVPRSLRMKRDVSDRRESYELKSYRPQNKVFAREEDCSHILEWIRRTQLR